MSREIDALVAEKVMGWSRVEGAEAIGALEARPAPSERMHNKRVWVDGDRLRACLECGTLPEFTTEPDADYEVLKRVRDTWLFSGRLAFVAALHDHWKRTRPTESYEVEPAWRVLFYQPGDYSRAALAALCVEVPDDR